jgi:hypothetical protein
MLIKEEEMKGIDELMKHKEVKNKCFLFDIGKK